MTDNDDHRDAVHIRTQLIMAECNGDEGAISAIVTLMKRASGLDPTWIRAEKDPYEILSEHGIDMSLLETLIADCCESDIEDTWFLLKCLYLKYITPESVKEAITNRAPYPLDRTVLVQTHRDTPKKASWRRYNIKGKTSLPLPL